MKKRNIIDELSINIGDEDCLDDFIITNIKKIPDLDIPSRDGKTLLHFACLYGRKSIVEFLLEQGANINVSDNSGDSVLHMAVLSKNISIVKLILSRGINVDIQNKLGNPPFWYVSAQTLNIATELLNNGANIHIKNNYNISPYEYLSNVPGMREFFNKGVC